MSFDEFALIAFIVISMLSQIEFFLDFPDAICPNNHIVNLWMSFLLVLHARMYWTQINPRKP